MIIITADKEKVIFIALISHIKMSESNIYVGKVKSVETLDEKTVKITYSDRITAGDGAKKDNMPGKGKMNLDLSHKLMMLLKEAGIPQHTIERQSDTVILAKKLKIFQLEVVVRNITAGSFCRRYGIEEGLDLEVPIVETFVKNDDLHDPSIDGGVAINQKYVDPLSLEIMKTRALQVNSILKDYFYKAGMLLVDFKLEFGKDYDGNVVLGDEISADSMRVWDINTREKLDKDRFRKDLGDVLAGYKVIMDRLESINYTPAKQKLNVMILINPKQGVNNPAGEVTKRTLVNFGVPGVGTVLVGKTIIVELQETEEVTWYTKLQKACDEIISNPLIETYEFRISY